jgi:hypothetical protein
MQPAGPHDGFIVVLLALCLALFVAIGLWVLLRPAASAYLAALVVGVGGAAMLALIGFIGWMGEEIGSPGTSKIPGQTFWLVLLQVGIAYLAFMLLLRTRAQQKS